MRKIGGGRSGNVTVFSSFSFSSPVAGGNLQQGREDAMQRQCTRIIGEAHLQDTAFKYYSRFDCKIIGNVIAGGRGSTRVCAEAR